MHAHAHVCLRSCIHVHVHEYWGQYKCIPLIEIHVGQLMLFIDTGSMLKASVVNITCPTTKRAIITYNTMEHKCVPFAVPFATSFHYITW